MGNRGGKFHRPDRTLGRRRWATRHWICCVLDWKGTHHEAMGDGYTSLFFLDEVTALSAGHRPCFFCRRHDAKRFLGLATPPLDADTADRRVDRERRGERAVVDTIALPDGAMIARDGEAYAVRGAHLLRWSFDGYAGALPRRRFLRATLLTPPLYVELIARGFEPRWHASARALIDRLR